MSREIQNIKKELGKLKLYNDVSNMIVSYISCQEHKCLLVFLEPSDASVCVMCMEKLQQELSDSWFSLQSEKEKKRIQMLFR